MNGVLSDRKRLRLKKNLRCKFVPTAEDPYYLAEL